MHFRFRLIFRFSYGETIDFKVFHHELLISLTEFLDHMKAGLVQYIYTRHVQDLKV